MHAPPYKEPVNYKSRDVAIYYFTGIAEEVYEPGIKIIDDCCWHMAPAKNVTSERAGWIKLLLASIGVRYRLKKRIPAATWITDFFSFGYFHWLNDVLPKIFLLKSKGINAVVLLPKNLEPIPFVKDSLGILEIDFKFHDPEDIVRVTKMYLPGQTAPEGSQHPVYFKQMANAFKPSKQVKPWRKIFISRENSPFRNLEPWESVKKMLLAMGFEIVLTGTMSLQEQIKMFSECSHLAAVHGGGLTNMAFMPENSKVFEIRRDDDNLNYCYYKMAHTLNLPYFYFLSSSLNNNPKIQNDNFLVDVEELEKELKKFIG